MADQIKDKSGLTPKQRHDIVMKYLKEIKKKPKVFHLRWKPGDLVDANVMKKTPLFWYMRYGWSRMQIETMLFKAKVEIDEVMDNGLQQVFGGDAGPRWRGGGGPETRKKWKNRAYASQKPWSGINANDDLQGKKGTDEKENLSNDKDQNFLNKEKLEGKDNDIWNAVSNFGESEWIDFQKFSDNLKERGIKISPDIAKALFDQIADPKTKKITKKQMQELIKKLDNMQFPDNFAAININDLNDPFSCYTVMKRVLLAAAAGQPFDVDGFLLNTNVNISIGPAGLLLGKLADRDADWNERLKAMEMISSNIGTNPAFDNLFQPDNAQELLCGWAAQILDGKPEIQKRAIDDVPLIFNNVLTKGDPDLAIGHLEEIMDNLFKVLDDPNASKNHKAAQDAVKKLVDDVLKQGDPEGVLYLAGILAEKTKLENSNNPKARQFALEQLQRVMFGENSPYVMDDKTDPAKVPKIDEDKLPHKPDPHREWLDIGAYIQMGPSDTLMYQGKLFDKQKPETLDELGKPLTGKYNQFPQKIPNQENAGVAPDDGKEEGYDPLETDQDNFKQKPSSSPFDPFPTNSKNRNRGKEKDITLKWGQGKRAPNEYSQDEEYGQKGRKVPNQESEGKDETNPVGGVGDEETMTGGPGRTGPVVGLHCDNKNPKKNEPVNFWVTCKDPNTPNKPGDANKLTKRNPYGTGPYTDKDHPENANDPVNDPNGNNPNPKGPNAKDDDQPGFINPNQKDYIKNYVYDFGDDSEPLDTDEPKAQHPYKKAGPKRATVTATDKYGLKGSSSIDLDVDGDPNKPKNTGPILDVKVSNPEPEKNEPVVFQVDQVGGTGKVKEYEVDFGDGTPPVKAKPNEPITHNYKSGGPKVATVKAIDDNGLDGSQQVKLDVKGDPRGPIVALHCDDKNPKINQPVNFWVTALNPNQPNKEVPLNKKKDNKPYYSYGKPGNKTQYSNSPLGDPNTNNPNKKGPNANDGNLPNFENPDKLPHIIQYDFDYGDNSPIDTKDEPKAQHPYKTKGPKTATVEVTDINGLKGSSSIDLDVDGNPNKPKNIGPITSVNVSNDNPAPNEPVKFKVDQLGGTGKIKEYVFDFGDGTPPIKSNKPEIEHKFPNEPGTKIATVKAIDENGLEGISQVKVVVDEPEHIGPVVALHCDNKNPKLNEPVHFWVTPVDPKTKKPNDDYKDADGIPNIVKYDFGFGDHTPHDLTNKPKSEHPYKTKGPKTATVVATDINGLTGSSEIDLDVDGKPNKPKNVGPIITAKVDNPKPKRNEPVTIDVEQLGGSAPIKEYIFDFGDGTKPLNTTKPKGVHKYPKKGVAVVTVEAIDDNGLTGTTQARIQVAGGYGLDDEDPGNAVDNPNKEHGGNKGKGNRGKPGFAGPFGNNDNQGKAPFGPDGNAQGAPGKDDALTPKEIGDEFRNVLRDAVAGAIMDPNKKNSDRGKKMTDLMKDLNPDWDKNLDPEARKRYLKYKGPPLKPYKPGGGPPVKKLPGLVVGKKRVHAINQTFEVKIEGPTLPDI